MTTEATGVGAGLDEKALSEHAPDGLNRHETLSEPTPSSTGADPAAQPSHSDSGEGSAGSSGKPTKKTKGAARSGQAAAREQAAQHASSEPELFSQGSERLALSVIMRAKDSAENTQHKLLALLAPEDFFLEQHQTIWRIAQQLKNANLSADAVSIADSAARVNEFIGGAQYLGALLTDPVCRAASHEAVTEAAGRIKELSMLRRLQASLRQGLALCSSGQSFASVLSFVEDDMVNLRNSAQTSRSGPQHISTFVNSVVARVEASLDGEVVMEGYPTNMRNFDQLTGGLLPETFTIIGARPSMGKTAFAMNIEQNLALAGTPTLFFSLEMSGASLAQRGIARHGRIPLKHIKRVDLNERELRDFIESADVVGKLPSFIDESPALTNSEIRARSRAFIAQYPEGVIWIDYLQLIAMDKNQKDRHAHISEVSRGLKGLARELKCPVVALSQLSRELEKRANKRPIISDLRESGQLEQDADVIAFLYRDEVYNPDTPDQGITEVIIAKNRDGETGTVRNSWQGDVMRTTEIDTVQTD